MRGTLGRAGAAVIVMAGTLVGATHAARADDPGLLALGAGAYDFLGGGDRPAGLFRAEYRFAQGLFFIKPIVGASLTTSGSVYAYGGLRADIILAEHYVIMPFGTVGFWSRGDGRNLGDHLEFSEGAEFAYRFDAGTRLGVSLSHMSNAGIVQRNPGEESILAVYSIPLGLPF
jgi:hypothetical protein